MKTQQNRQEQQLEPGNRRRVNWKLIDRLAKLFVVLLILALCWNVVSTALWTPDQQASVRLRASSSLAAEDRTSDPNQLFVEFTSGSWNFGSSQWQIQVYPESKEQGLLDPPDFRRSANPEFDDQECIGILRGLGAQPQRLANGLERWQSDNLMGISVVLFTQDSIVQVMRTRFPTDSGSSIVEGRPRSSRSESSEQLMPLMEGVNQVASRMDVNGRVTSAILEVDPDYKSDLRSFWNEQGWQVIPLPGIRAAVEQDGVPVVAKYRCTKDQLIIEATFFLDQFDHLSQVMLMVFPSDHD